MKDSKKTEVIRWAPAPGSDRPALPEGEMYRRFILLSALTGVVLFAALIALVYMLMMAFSPPRVIAISGNGWAFSSPLVEFGPASMSQADRERVEDRIFDEVFEAAWTRTDAANLDDQLKDFILPAPLSFFRDATREHENRKSGFQMGVDILERRVAQRTPSAVVVMYHLRLNVTVLKDQSFSEIYIATLFRKMEPTRANPLGWRLFTVMKTTSEAFYQEELSKETERLFAQ